MLLISVRAAILALGTYTKIPAPQIKWDDSAMKLAIAFLPLAGAAVGIVLWGWQLLCRCLELSAVLFAAVSAVLPLLITGGIHMDGFCDTSDALASRQGRERSLEIMKDPHMGAFALIRFGMYMLVDFAVLHELFLRGFDAGIGFLFVISRCFAVLGAITMPNARKEGMLAAYTEKADRRAVSAVLAVFAVLGVAGWVFFTFPRGLFGLALTIPVTLLYRRTAKKRFGGATGDTTGYYLQTLELCLPIGLLLGGVVLERL